MSREAIFWLQILASALVFSLVAVWYVWPRLIKIPRGTALTLLLFVMVFRYVGMTELVHGMIDPSLSKTFRNEAAYGDLAAAALALASIFALRKNWAGAIPLVWVANTWGFLDLLNGFRGVLELNVPQYNLATLWYVYVFYAPIVIVAHILIFTVLLKPDTWKKATVKS